VGKGPFHAPAEAWPRLARCCIAVALAAAVLAAGTLGTGAGPLTPGIPAAAAKKSDRDDRRAERRERRGERRGRGNGWRPWHSDRGRDRPRRPWRQRRPHKPNKPSKPNKPDDRPEQNDKGEDKPEGQEDDGGEGKEPEAEPSTDVPAPPTTTGRQPSRAPSGTPSPPSSAPPATVVTPRAPDRGRGGPRRVTRRRVAARGDGRLAVLPPDLASGSDGGSEGVAGDLAVGSAGGGPSGGSDGLLRDEDPAGRRDRPAADDGEGSTVTRTVRDIVEVVPDSIKGALAALAALSILLGAGSLFSALRARRLDRQRRQLLQEVGLLQSALLPPVPERLGALRTSVAYRPADGPGAGGDFYDAVELGGGRTAFILGDVSGHGRDALERTAFMRFTLRAYLGAGLEPRGALQVAGQVIDEHLGGDFATVVIAVHDPGTGSLTYAAAGHPAPIVVGPSAHEPILAASSPPIGVGVGTGLRQTTVPLAPGSVACFYTDGLTEARTETGILGRGKLGDLLSELGRDATAAELLDSVADEARLVSDDMAACLLSPTAGVTAGGFRTEELELPAEDVNGGLGESFLEACGIAGPYVEAAMDEARRQAERSGGAVLHVVFGNRRTVEVLPRNLESLEAASRRAAAS
jgi:hypothetical protein